MGLSSTRDEVINDWAKSQLGDDCLLSVISGDASFRRYFRVQYQDNAYIIMDSPVELVPLAPFIAIADAYQNAQINVPNILAYDQKLGLMLLQDLGDIQLLGLLADDNMAGFYHKALAILPKIASVTATSDGNLISFDDAFVHRELTIFTDWLVKRHLQLALSAQEQALLEQAFAFLARVISEQPQVGMHRDFHSRNLMLFDNELYAIDFQDAVLGPITYDAVSLLRDCYIRWPQEAITPLMKVHFDLCIEHGFLSADANFEQYERWFDLTGLQRHIKAAGIFARLHYRDNKPGYMSDIPMTLDYIIDISAKYPELTEFNAWVRARVLPEFSPQK